MSVVDEARAMVGTRFRHKGRDARGYDCVGVIVEAYRRALGVDIDDRDYRKDVPRSRAIGWVNEHFERLGGREEARAGDMALITLGGGGTSFAIVTEKGGAIFASGQVGAVVEISRLHDVDIIGFYRLVGG
jgi:cell wall-associated NlpC family hydrolase